MSTTCERCGRPKESRSALFRSDARVCTSGSVCGAIADAYRRGLREGVAIAKEHATIERHTFRIVPTILWSEVDAEIARLTNNNGE